MAHSVLSSTFVNGFREPAEKPHWGDQSNGFIEPDTGHETPPFAELLTSPCHNNLGFNVLRTWPTLYDGTASPHGIPEWWHPRSKVDVLICGAGPSGLEVALSLVRQGLTFRIIDKAPSPLLAGRADGVQPRFLETLASWGLASEVHEEGPIVERTAIYYNGHLLHHGRSHQSDSRYRGLHIITQGQIERIFIRDLLRHKMLVERNTILEHFNVDQDHAQDPTAHPVQCVIKNNVTQAGETIQAKYLIGSDGASSSIRHRLSIPFDGISTEIYWGIMDCMFATDYPHAWIFGSVVSSEHGGCVIIPRENGYIRLYTQLDVSRTNNLADSGTDQVDIHSITPEEVLEQANRIFAPYKLSFAAPLSWFAVWKISERVARSFSSDDLRVHLVGDAAHVHSVMGAFGLNASILDAANISWKLGMCVNGQARMDKLLPTYDRERRLHAASIIDISGKYLRFVCNSQLPTVQVYGLGADLGLDKADPRVNTVKQHAEKAEPAHKRSNFASRDEAKAFVGAFFTQHGQFLLGVDAAYGHTCLNPPTAIFNRDAGKEISTSTMVRNGVRAPNPRICLNFDRTGYLYDVLQGAGRFHLVVFGSSLRGAVRQKLLKLASTLTKENSRSFYWRFGGPVLFNTVLVAKGTPFEIDEQLAESSELRVLRQVATVLADDRAPDEDAHSTWGVDHRQGAVVLIRPDLWVGISVMLDDTDRLGDYLDGFLTGQHRVDLALTRG